MELKEAILSTLAELQENPSAESRPIQESPPSPEPLDSFPLPAPLPPAALPLEIPAQPSPILSEESPQPSVMGEEERRFLEGLRERILVLFEGMQSPNNRNIEAKVELSLSFFEYLLSIIDERLEERD